MKLPINVRRIFAYIIDTLIVTIIASLIAKTPINFQNEKYTKAAGEYTTLYNEYTGTLTELNDLYKTDSFSTEKVIEVLENYDIQSEEIFSDEISRDDYDAVIKSINLYYTEDLNSAMYKMDRYSLGANVITIVLILLYFTLMPYFMKGQTIGKKLAGIQVVSSRGNNKLGVLHYLLRAFILYGVWMTSINIILLVCLGESIYVNVSSTLYLVSYFIEFVSYGLILFTKDKRGIHDFISQTKVIEYKKES